MTQNVSHGRWRFAQQCEREYQERKVRSMRGRESSLVSLAEHNSVSIARYLESVGYAVDEGLVVEVGSGASGLIWRWPAKYRVAIDPLAHFYRQAFPKIQSDGPWIVQAQGEQLPLSDSCTSLVLSDNVLDHVESPSGYLAECHRILKPGGVLYMTVDVHHPVYWWAGKFYNFLCAFGIRARVPAFPNHPFHFTRERVETLVAHAGLKTVTTKVAVVANPGTPRGANLFRKPIILLKSMFFKNVRWQLIATT